MRQRQHRVALATPPAAPWPPDDTEESVVGTNLHQATITNLRLGLNEVASIAVPAGQRVPWQALSQTAISGFRRPDGTPFTALPDAFVYRRPIDERRATLYLAQEGAPALIAEVLSPTTYDIDLDLDRGKGYSYARAGVPEYMVLDPTGEYVPEQVRAWRLRAGKYVPWTRDAAGRWQSQEIPAAVCFEGIRIVVYTRDGRRQLGEGEIARELARKDEEIAALRRLLEQRDQP